MAGVKRGFKSWKSKPAKRVNYYRGDPSRITKYGTSRDAVDSDYEQEGAIENHKNSLEHEDEESPEPTRKTKSNPTEWRDTYKEYKSWPRNLRISPAPWLRLFNTERRSAFKALCRAESRGEVPYAGEKDKDELDELYKDLRRDFNNIRKSVKMAQKYGHKPGQSHMLFSLIDEEEDHLVFDDGEEWDRDYHKGDDNEEDEENDQEDDLWSEDEVEQEDEDELVDGDDSVDEQEDDNVVGRGEEEIQDGEEEEDPVDAEKSFDDDSSSFQEELVEDDSEDVDYDRALDSDEDMGDVEEGVESGEKQDGGEKQDIDAEELSADDSSVTQGDIVEDDSEDVDYGQALGGDEDMSDAEGEDPDGSQSRPLIVEDDEPMDEAHDGDADDEDNVSIGEDESVASSVTFDPAGDTDMGDNEQSEGSEDL